MMTLGRNDAAITASFIDGLTLEGPLGHAGMNSSDHVNSLSPMRE
jgi:hypothetical protein